MHTFVSIVLFVFFVVKAMSEEEQRARVVAEAKTWLGTPFRNCADVKGAGVDCAMLLIRVFADMGVIADFDPRPYSFQWHMHHDEERFLAIVGKLGREVERQPGAGDVIVYRFGRCFSHGALVIDECHVLHAWNLEERVTISPMHDVALTQLGNGRPRPRKLFDPWAAREQASGIRDRKFPSLIPDT